MARRWGRVWLVAGALAALGLPTVGAAAPAGAGEGATPAAAPAPPKDQLVTFEKDAGGPKPNGFTSADSPFVHFSDTNGAQLAIGNFGSQGEGAASLVAGTDFDNSGILMVFDRVQTHLQIRFGNDDPNFTDPGDEAVLTLFRGTTQVGEVRVLLNRNDAMDQTIFATSDGPLFNRAIFKFDVNPGKGVQEVIDHLVFGPNCTIAGSSAGETLNGTSGNDVICGGPGSDTVFGKGGNDFIFGGTGDDKLNGEDGNDFIRGNRGKDTINGGNQDDRLEGSEDNDTIFGAAGLDILDGGPQTDRCDGGTQSDTATACETKVAIP